MRYGEAVDAVLCCAAPANEATRVPIMWTASRRRDASRGRLHAMRSAKGERSSEYIWPQEGAWPSWM
jgi:hypothetical protein